MRTIVVCGPLGSGKTTFLRHLIGSEQGNSVFLVNDFGKLGIDAEILASAGADVVELPSGCVCCTLRQDLVSSVQAAVDQFHPARLYVEPSGVATASGVIEGLNSAGIHNMSVVSLVDVTDFLELYRADYCGRFLIDQIEQADIVLVNKIDLVSSELTQETSETVQALDPRAIVMATSHSRLDAVLPFSLHLPRVSDIPEHRVETLSIRIASGMNRDRLRSCFEQMASGTFGHVTRAKGIVETSEGPFQFDLASGRVTLAPHPASVSDSRIVVIGEAIDEAGLRLLFESAI